MSIDFTVIDLRQDLLTYLKSNREQFQLIGSTALNDAGLNITPSDEDRLVSMSELQEADVDLSNVDKLAIQAEDNTKYGWALIVINLDEEVFEAKLYAHNKAIKFVEGELGKLRMVDKQFRYGFACALIFQHLGKII